MEILCLFLFSYQNAPLYSLFQSTLPIQGETELTYEVTEIKMEFQSTLPIQGETGKK